MLNKLNRTDVEESESLNRLMNRLIGVSVEILTTGETGLVTGVRVEGDSISEIKVGDAWHRLEDVLFVGQQLRLPGF